MGVLSLIIVFLCSILCPFWFCTHISEVERAGCFTLFLFLMPSVASPRDARVGLQHARVQEFLSGGSRSV